MNVPDETQAYAEIVGEYPNQKLNLHLPRGDRGEKGEKGDKGDTGDTGASTTLTVLETTTGVDYQYPGPVGPKGDKGDPGGFVTGTLLNTSDLNTITTSGIYRQDNGTNIRLTNNYPENSGETGVLYVSQASGTSFIEQEWHPSDAVRYSRIFWKRSYNYGVWRPWRAFAATRIDQTSGRAIYMWDDINNREQMVYGDTGARGIGDILLNGWTSNSAAEVVIRREGSIVTLNAKMGSNVATSELFYTLPNGWRPRTQDQHLMSGSTGAGTYAYSRARWDGNLYMTYTTYGTVYVAGTWTTNDTWPTTLPGSAVGTIPNA